MEKKKKRRLSGKREGPSTSTWKEKTKNTPPEQNMDLFAEGEKKKKAFFAQRNSSTPGSQKKKMLEKRCSEEKKRTKGKKNVNLLLRITKEKEELPVIIERKGRKKAVIW